MHLIASLNNCDTQDIPFSLLYLHIYKFINGFLGKCINSKEEWELRSQGLQIFIEMLKKVSPEGQISNLERGPDLPIGEYIAGLEFVKANVV